MLSHVLGAVDKTSSSFSAHGKIGNFIIIIKQCGTCKYMYRHDPYIPNYSSCSTVSVTFVSGVLSISCFGFYISTNTISETETLILLSDKVK